MATNVVARLATVSTTLAVVRMTVSHDSGVAGVATIVCSLETSLLTGGRTRTLTLAPISVRRFSGRPSTIQGI